MRYKQPFTIIRPDRKKGGSWRYRLGSDPKRVLLSTGKKTKWEARQFCEDLQSKKTQTQVERPMTFGEFAQEFFIPGKCEYLSRRADEGYEFPFETIQHQRGVLVNYLFPRFADVPLEAIKVVEFERWRKGLVKLDGSIMSNATKNHIRYVLKLILDQALRMELIKSNPISLTKQMNKKLYKRRDILTPEEIAKLFPVDQEELLRIWRREDYITLYYLLLSSGLRAGEVRALRWGKIIWDQKGIIVDSAAKRKHNIIGLPKNKRIRVVLLNDRCLGLLAAVKKNSISSDNSAFVFPGIKGDCPISSEAILRNFKQGLRRAGINIDGKKNLVAHFLRHSFNTTLAKIIPTQILQQMTGHLSDEMTEHYSHLTPNDLLGNLIKYRDTVNKAFAEKTAQNDIIKE
jgi:integrase